MSEVKRCAACGKENLVREMKTCMHSQMHYYVCDSKCMDDFYSPPKKPTERELRIKAETERDAALAELAALKGGQERQQLVVGSTYTSTRGFGRLLYLGETHDIDGWLATFRTTDGRRKHYSHDQLADVLEEFAAPPSQASAWVAVSERLPVHLELVLVWLAYSDDEGERQETIDFADFHAPSQDNQWFSPYAFSAEQHPHVTHWQPITAPTPGASDGKGGE